MVPNVSTSEFNLLFCHLSKLFLSFCCWSLEYKQYFNSLHIVIIIIIIIRHHLGVLPKGRSFTANSRITAAVLPNGRSSTENSGTKVASSCGSFSLLSALEIVGILKITPHSFPWLEVDISKIRSPIFRFLKYCNPTLWAPHHHHSEIYHRYNKIAASENCLFLRIMYRQI